MITIKTIEMKQFGEGIEILLFWPNQDNQDKDTTVIRIIKYNKCFIPGFIWMKEKIAFVIRITM